MSASVIIRHHRHIVVLSTLLNSALLLLMQIGLWYVSMRTAQTLWWLIGTPLCSFLIGGQGAFWATGSLASQQSRRRGTLIGAGSVMLAALILLLLSIWWVENARPDAQRIPLLNLFVPPGIISLEAFLGVFLVFFLISNLLSIALALPGGIVRGYRRAHQSEE